LRSFAIKALLALFALLFLLIYLLPFGNMLTTAFSTLDQLSKSQNSTVLPVDDAMFNYQGKNVPIVKVPLETGIKQLALIKKGSDKSQFIDPANPNGDVIEWTGNWRTLDKVQSLSLHPENFPKAWEQADFPLLFRNTLI